MSENSAPLLKLDNTAIVVEGLYSAISSFIELSTTLEYKAVVVGKWAGKDTGLSDLHVEIAGLHSPSACEFG